MIGPYTEVDSEVQEALDGELERQRMTIDLIASENFASPAVLAAQGSVLTNKYAEGYPGKRYYGGCEQVDKIEVLAIERAKEIFGAEHVNVQPHSGSQANEAAYAALVEPGDKVLSMDLAHGGHLTHGMKINFSGRTYDFAHYGVGEDGYIDYDQVREIALRERPRLILAGASAYPRVLHFDRFREIADEVGAFFLTDMAHDDPQDAAGGPRGYDPLPRRVRQEGQQSRLPRYAGWPSHARYRGQSRGVRRGFAARVQGLCSQDRRELPGSR